MGIWCDSEIRDNSTTAESTKFSKIHFPSFCINRIVTECTFSQSHYTSLPVIGCLWQNSLQWDVNRASNCLFSACPINLKFLSCFFYCSVLGWWVSELARKPHIKDSRAEFSWVLEWPLTIWNILSKLSWERDI